MSNSRNCLNGMFSVVNQMFINGRVKSKGENKRQGRTHMAWPRIQYATKSDIKCVKRSVVGQSRNEKCPPRN